MPQKTKRSDKFFFFGQSEGKPTEPEHKNTPVWEIAVPPGEILVSCASPEDTRLLVFDLFVEAAAGMPFGFNGEEGPCTAIRRMIARLVLANSQSDERCIPSVCPFRHNRDALVIDVAPTKSEHTAVITVTKRDGESLRFVVGLKISKDNSAKEEFLSPFQWKCITREIMKFKAKGQKED